MTTDQAREHLADVWTAAQATTHDKAEFECMKRGFIAGHEWATKDSIATIERLEGELRYIDKRCEEQIQDRIRLGEALTLATRERDEAVANKNAEIELLVDLLKRGFAISNREGWEEGENKTEWQSIASDVIATYDRKYRQHGLRSIEDRIALEKQQDAEIVRLTQERDAAVKVIERLDDVQLESLRTRFNQLGDEAQPGSVLDRFLDDVEACICASELARDFLSRQEGK